MRSSSIFFSRTLFSWLSALTISMCLRAASRSSGAALSRDRRFRISAACGAVPEWVGRGCGDPSATPGCYPMVSPAVAATMRRPGPPVLDRLTSGNLRPTARWAQHRPQLSGVAVSGQAGTLAAVSAEIKLTSRSETVPRPVDRISRLTRAGGWLLDAAATGPQPRRAGCGEPGLEARPRHGSARCCGPALDDTDTADPYRRYRPDHRSARPAHRVPRRLSNRRGHWCRTEFNQILIRPTARSAGPAPVQILTIPKIGV